MVSEGAQRNACRTHVTTDIPIVLPMHKRSLSTPIHALRMPAVYAGRGRRHAEDALVFCFLFYAPKGMVRVRLPIVGLDLLGEPLSNCSTTKGWSRTGVCVFVWLVIWWGVGLMAGLGGEWTHLGLQHWATAFLGTSFAIEGAAR